MKTILAAAFAVIFSTGASFAAVGDEVCIKTGSGSVTCGTVVIQR